MNLKFEWRGLAIFGVILFILSLPLIGSYLPQNMPTASSAKNFEQDLNKAGSYWTHNNLAFDYAKNGQYDMAVVEYIKAIEFIEKMPGDSWPNLKQEDVDRMNQQTRIDAQIFSRYGLIEALEGVGRYEEAIHNVEWLQHNQIMRGKEEFLRNKLAKMKADLQAKMAQTRLLSEES